MIPVLSNLFAAAALPLAITHHAVSPRRVWVRDPAGMVMVGRQGVLERVTCMGGIVECCHVRFDACVEGSFPPDWVSDVPDVDLVNVVPFPVRPR